jgi:hypothetical protein
MKQVMADLKANSAESSKRYWHDSGQTHFSIIEATTRVRFAYSRRRALPQVEDDGKLTNLVLRPTAGLAEQIHIRFFADSVAGADFNHFGPRVTRFGQFITATTGSPVAFEPLLRANVLKELDQLDEVTLIELKVDASFARGIRRHDRFLGDAISSAGRAAGGGVVQLKLSPARFSRGHLQRPGILQWLSRIAADPDSTEHVHVFRVAGRDGDNELDVNLLRDKLVYRAAIVTVDDRHRVLDTEAAYAAIGHAYNELKDEINAAASVS